MFYTNNAMLGQSSQDQLAKVEEALKSLISVDLTPQEARGILQARAVMKTSLFGLDPIMDHKLSSFETTLANKLAQVELQNRRKAEEKKQEVLKPPSEAPKISVKVKKKRGEKAPEESKPITGSEDVSNSAGADEI